MTDLSSMRDRMGASMRPAEAPQQGLLWGKGPAVKEYFTPKAMWNRFSGKPTPEQEVSLALFREWSKGKDFGEIAKGIDQFDIPVMAEPIDNPLGAMLPAKGFSQAEKLVQGYGRRMIKSGMPRAAAYAEEGVAFLELRDLFKALPESVWEKLDALLPAKHIPGVKRTTQGLYVTAGDTRKIWLSTKSYEPIKDLGHEIAHHVDAILGEGMEHLGEGVSHSSFAKLRSIWSDMSDDMASMGAFWKNRSSVEAEVLYRHSPNEIFARRFADAIVDDGVDFREAVKIATHETRANLAKSREALEESIDAANVYLMEHGDPNEIPMPHYW